MARRRLWLGVIGAVVTALGCLRDFDMPFSASDSGAEDGSSVTDGGRRRDAPIQSEDAEDIPPGCPPAIVLTAFDAPNAAWQLRGDAVLSDADSNTIAMIPVEFFRTGAVWWSSPLSIRKITATFGFRSRGGAGYPAADGVVFALVGGAAVPDVGANGGAMGFCSLGGFGVALDMLSAAATDPAPNLKIWAGATDGGSTCNLLAESPMIPRLIDGAVHDIRVVWDVDKSAVEVSVDATVALIAHPDVRFAIPSYMGFTAASGGYRGSLEVATPSITVTPPCP